MTDWWCSIYRWRNPTCSRRSCARIISTACRAGSTQAADYYRAGQIYPLSYLISRDGRVAKRWSGRPAENWLRESIREEL